MFNEENVELIDRNKLEPDAEWSDYYDDYVSYSQSQIKSAPIVKAMSLDNVEQAREEIKQLPITDTAIKLVTEVLDKYAIVPSTKSEKAETKDVKTVTLTPYEIKMMQISLYHQWFKMTDDDGKAINCEQKSADCVYDLLNRFEKLRAEVEDEKNRK